MTRICCISDTHHLHRQVVVPPSDILIFAGDLTRMGMYDDVVSFLDWFRKQPAKHCVYIAGNHDFCYQKKPDWLNDVHKEYGEIDYLENSAIVLDGLKIWGSPFSPEFGNWAFSYPRDGMAAQLTWSAIPSDADIVITHGPPLGINDYCVYHPSIPGGCPTLRDRIASIKPKMHVFGHIHESYGVHWNGDTHYVNASTCNLQYRPVNKPVTIDI